MSFAHVNWKRPNCSEYPRVWHNFEVKKIDFESNQIENEFEEYYIQDLTESRMEDALEFMVENYCKDETLSMAYEIYNEKDIIEHMKNTWKTIIKQKTPLVCFQKGSDEIVGINMNCVVHKYDVPNDAFDFIENSIFYVIHEYRVLQFCLNSFYRCNRNQPAPLMPPKINEIGDITEAITENFNEFKHYGVYKYLTAYGLAVARKYRGRGIGVQLLKTGEIFCNEFGIKLILDSFTSNSANACADKAGYKLQRILRYDDIRKMYPHLPHVESDAITLKFMKFHRQNE